MKRKRIHKNTIGITLLILCFLPLSLRAGQMQQVLAAQDKLELSVAGEQVSLQEAITRIEDKFGANIMFKTQQVRDRYVPKQHILPDDLASALHQLLQPLNMAYEQINAKNYIIYEQAEPVLPKVVQEIVTGTVTDGQSGETLPGVNVLVKGTTTGTSTDEEGNFELTVQSLQDTLVVSFVGYQTQEVPIQGQTEVNVALQQRAIVGEDVVVIGYGTQAERDVAESIVSVSGEDMGSSPGSTISSALQGKVPGMQIISNSGEPGGGVDIKIRGASSISGGSTPLYIIDGVPVDAENIASLNGDATFSPLAGINPDDIKSIEILKDAASAAIYGSRAANGVVIITTKGGNDFKVMAPRVSLSQSSSMVQIGRKLDVMNGGQFREAYKDSRNNNGQNPTTRDWITNPHHPYYNNTTDWQDILFRNAYQHSSNLRLQGSSETLSYGISLGYKNLQPTIVHTDYEQLNMRGNFSYKLSNWISAATRVSFSQQDYTRILSSSSNYYSALRAALFTNPVFAPYDPLSGEVVDWLGKREQRNPLAVAEKVPITFGRNNIGLTQEVTVELLRGLDFESKIWGNFSSVEQTFYQPKSFSSATPRRDDGRFYETESKILLNENTLNYLRLFNKHRISAVLGQSVEQRSSERVRHQGEDFVDSNVTPIQGAARMTRIERNVSHRAMLSFFGRVKYSYDSKYLASFTLRRDGSSRFGSNKRYGNFPAASLGWRFSDERFLDFADGVLDNGMLRASYGVTGNQFVSYYAWQGEFSPTTSRYGGHVAIRHDDLMNTNLGWETTTQYNLGLDLSFLNERVNFTADVYKKQSEDLLFNFPINYYTGFSSISRNYGSIENQGLELMVEATPIDQAFKWESSINLTFNRNKVTALPENEDILIGGYSLGRIGQPAGVFYAHRALGVYSRDEDNVYTAPDGTVGKYRRGSATGEAFGGGDMIWDDIDGNGIIDDNDRVIIGSPHPKFTGGFNNTMGYKNFSLKFSFYWSYGNKIMNELRRRRNQMLTTGNLGKDALKRWRQPGDATNFPMIRYQDLMGNFRHSTFTMEDGSYLRLKEVVIGYTFPEQYLKKIFVNSLDVYISGTNLLTWSKYSGYDPEVNTSTNPFISGVDNGAIPQSRTFNVGLSVQF